MKAKRSSTDRSRRGGFVATRPPISYDPHARSIVRKADMGSILASTGWHSPFRQTHILNLVDLRWCLRAHLDFDVVLHLQPWPMRLLERFHPFYPQPKRHKGIWGRGRLEAVSRRGIRRRPNEHRRRMELPRT